MFASELLIPNPLLVNPYFPDRIVMFIGMSPLSPLLNPSFTTLSPYFSGQFPIFTVQSPSWTVSIIPMFHPNSSVEPFLVIAQTPSF